MLRLVIVKSLRALITVVLCVTFVFVVLRLSGDPAQALLPENTPPDIMADYRARWGLDRPLPEQYLRYVAAVANGDFGRSFADNREALGVVLERVPATLLLGCATLALALSLGIPLGMLAALRRNTAVDRAVMGFAVFGYATPHYFLGILLILLFAMTLRWLPSSGDATWWHLIMPVATLGTSAAGTLARFTRTAMLEVMGQPSCAPQWAKVHGRAMLSAAMPCRMRRSPSSLSSAFRSAG